MFHLVVTACLLADPAVCGRRLLPAAEGADEAACMALAPAAMRDWGAAHASGVSGPRCVPTATLPATALTEVAPGVLVHAGVPAMAAAANRGRIANMGVILGPAIAVIDPGGSRAEAEALYAAIRRRSGAPVTTVILTHAHPDHSLGAAFFAEAGARVIASPAYAAEIAPRAATWLGPYGDAIGRGEMLGSALVPADPPDAPPPGLRLFPVPPAHSGADMMVLHEPSGTLFAGDLVFRGLTPVVEGSLNGWLAWLDGPLPPARAIVPGHGPVARDWAEASGPMRAYLVALRGATRAEIAAGTPLSAAIPRIVDALAPLALGWAEFGPVTERNAAAAYAELEWE